MQINTINLFRCQWSVRVFSVSQERLYIGTRRGEFEQVVEGRRTFYFRFKNCEFRETLDHKRRVTSPRSEGRRVGTECRGTRLEGLSGTRKQKRHKVCPTREPNLVAERLRV